MAVVWINIIRMHKLAAAAILRMLRTPSLATSVVNTWAALTTEHRIYSKCEMV